MKKKAFRFFFVNLKDLLEMIYSKHNIFMQPIDKMQWPSFLLKFTVSPYLLHRHGTSWDYRAGCGRHAGLPDGVRVGHAGRLQNEAHARWSGSRGQDKPQANAHRPQVSFITFYSLAFLKLYFVYRERHDRDRLCLCYTIPFQFKPNDI